MSYITDHEVLRSMNTHLAQAYGREATKAAIDKALAFCKVESIGHLKPSALSSFYILTKEYLGAK